MSKTCVTFGTPSTGEVSISTSQLGLCLKTLGDGNRLELDGDRAVDPAILANSKGGRILIAPYIGDD